METDTRDAASFEPRVRPARSDRYARRALAARGLAAVLAVTALAAGLRFYHLSQPREYVFDEVYYAKDGCYDAGLPYEACGLDAPREQTVTVHPPLGRELVGRGIVAYGNRPFGWRVAAAVFGTASVFLLGLLALWLFESVLWAAAAALLLATEHLNFVQSRISMLDVFVTTFVVAGFLFLVLDRRWIERRTSLPEPVPEEDDEDALLMDVPPDRPPSPLFRPWLLAAGVAFGAAVATKWSGGTALAGALLLHFGWERTRRARAGVDHPWAETLRAESFGAFLFLVVVPLVVYVASYARWFSENGLDLGDWVSLQRGMATFSLGLASEHPYQSRPWKWILLARPVAYYYKSGTPPGTAAEILGMGNPMVFWGGALALLYTSARWLGQLGRRRSVVVLLWAIGVTAAAVATVLAIRAVGAELGSLRGREAELLSFLFLFSGVAAAALSTQGADRVPGFVVVAFAAQYLPWFVTGRTSFFFYMTPVTPFLCLALVYALKRMAEVRVGETGTRVLAPVAGLAVILSVLVFAYFFPVLTGRTISHQEWQERMWFGCGDQAVCIWNWI